MTERCPLCQGKVINGRCKDCGYAVPDENELEEISELYNGEPYKTENSDVGYADPYMPDIRNMPNIEVVEEPSWHRVNPQKSRWQSPNQQNNAQSNITPQSSSYQQANSPNQQANMLQNNQQQYYWQNHVQENNNQLQPNQWQNGMNINYTGSNSPPSPYSQNSAGQQKGKSVFARRWWMFLLALILPFPAGLIFFAVLIKSSDDEDRKLAFPLLAVMLISFLISMAQAGMFSRY